eukprot:658625-Hanusia_phi.AAC.6
MAHDLRLQVRGLVDGQDGEQVALLAHAEERGLPRRLRLGVAQPEMLVHHLDGPRDDPRAHVDVVVRRQPAEEHALTLESPELRERGRRGAEVGASLEGGEDLGEVMLVEEVVGALVGGREDRRHVHEHLDARLRQRLSHPLHLSVVHAEDGEGNAPVDRLQRLLGRLIHMQAGEVPPKSPVLDPSLRRRHGGDILAVLDDALGAELEVEPVAFVKKLPEQLQRWLPPGRILPHQVQVIDEEGDALRALGSIQPPALVLQEHSKR